MPEHRWTKTMILIWLVLILAAAAYEVIRWLKG